MKNVNRLAIIILVVFTLLSSISYASSPQADFEAAKARGDNQGMAAAHAVAESLRNESSPNTNYMVITYTNSKDDFNTITQEPIKSIVFSTDAVGDDTKKAWTSFSQDGFIDKAGRMHMLLSANELNSLLQELNFFSKGSDLRTGIIEKERFLAIYRMGTFLEFSGEGYSYNVNGTLKNFPDGMKASFIKNKSDKYDIPVRLFMELMGLKITWDAQNSRVIVQ